jgi:hypothetical protein
MLASRKLDAAQEQLEREVKRLITRKKSVPELADAERLSQLAQGIDGSLNNLSQVIAAVAQSWGSQY